MIACKQAVSGLFATLFLLLSFGARAGEDCAHAERDIEARRALTASSADMDGAIRSLYTAAREALDRCPSSEPLSYVVARASELGYADDPRSAGPPPRARQFIEDAVTRHPQSVRLATVSARIAGGSVNARRAYDLDKSYMPARATLAVALANEGHSAEALGLFPQANKRNLTVSEGIARSRVLLAAGRAAAARREAAAALNAPGQEIEIVVPRDLERDVQEIWGLALIAEGRPQQAAAHLKTAAALGSARASAALRDLR